MSSTITLSPQWYTGFNYGWYKKQSTDWETGNEYCGYADSSAKAFVVALDIPTGHIGTIDSITVSGIKFKSEYTTSNAATLDWVITDKLNQNDYTNNNSILQGTTIAKSTVTAPAASAGNINLGTWKSATGLSYKIDTSEASERVYLYILNPNKSTTARWRRAGFQIPTVVVNYTPDLFTIHTNKGTGIASVTCKGSAAYRETVSIQATPSTGFEFSKWTGDTSYLTNVNSASTKITMPKQSVTFQAEAKQVAYKLSFIHSLSDVDSVEDDYKIHGTVYELQEPDFPVAEHTTSIMLEDALNNIKSFQEVTITSTYRFDCWKDSKGNEYQAGDEYEENTEEVFQLFATKVKTFSTITLPELKKPGYKFLGWRVNNKKLTQIYPSGEFNPTSTDSLVAVWQRIESNIQIDDSKYNVRIYSNGKWLSAGAYVCVQEGQRYIWKFINM